MKTNFIKVSIIFTVIFSIIILFSNLNAAYSSEAIPDNIYVLLNGSPVQGANVTICNTGISGTTGSTGLFGFNITSGTYQIVVNYGTYGASTFRKFSSGEDFIEVNLVSGNVGCDNN